MVGCCTQTRILSSMVQFTRPLLELLETFRNDAGQVAVNSGLAWHIHLLAKSVRRPVKIVLSTPSKPEQFPFPPEMLPHTLLPGLNPPAALDARAILRSVLTAFSAG